MRAALLLACGLAFGGHADAGEIRWPDPGIRVPPLVHLFILSECREFAGSGEETVAECIAAERYGYRAVVAMLMDEQLGERAADRYRGCHAGLGREGGQFHRRKAECISAVFKIVWRFEFSRETRLAPGPSMHGPAKRFAGLAMSVR